MAFMRLSFFIRKKVPKIFISKVEIDKDKYLVEYEFDGVS